MAESSSNLPEVNVAAETAQTVLGKELSSLILCYVSCSKDSGNAFVGAGLLTDHRTRPLEFCYIAPVRPTVYQRLLYGRTLDEHVNVDVITKKLLEGFSRKPDIIFVDSEILLEARRLCEIPVTLLQKSPDAGTIGPKLSPYTYKVADNSRYEEEVAQAVGILETQILLCDPFDRIKEALKEALRSKPQPGA